VSSTKSVITTNSTYVNEGVSPLVKLKVGRTEGSNVGATSWTEGCAVVCVWLKMKFGVGLVKFWTGTLADAVAGLAVKPNTFELGCELLEPKLNAGVLVAAVTAAVVVAGLLLLGLLAPNTEAAAPNTGPLAGAGTPNSREIAVLDVVATLDPKLKVGAT
jgi:hypothetical protein